MYEILIAVKSRMLKEETFGEWQLRNEKSYDALSELHAMDDDELRHGKNRFEGWRRQAMTRNILTLPRGLKCFL